MPVVHGETETVLLARPDAGQVMEGLQLIDGGVWRDDVNGTEKENGYTEAVEDTPDERTDGGQCIICLMSFLYSISAADRKGLERETPYQLVGFLCLFRELFI